MDWWKQKFIEWFEVNHLMLDLMDEVDDDTLFKFIIKKVRNEFSPMEIQEQLQNELSDKEIDSIIGDVWQ